MTEKTLSLKFNVPIFKMDLLSANWEKVMAKNENFKLFDGVYEGLGPCTILILYNIEKNIDAFYKISTQINIFSNFNYHYMAKLFGIIVDREKFCLVFERLSCSLDSRLNTKSITDKEKFVALSEVMELILFLHENKMKAYDLRPSNIFMTEQGDVRMIYPLENIHLFRDDVEEEEEIIEKLLNHDDYFLRYTAPELLQDPQVMASINDIWMLGCLFIELFSKYKVWDGYTENEIIKQLKNLSIPKIPNDVPQTMWGLICECLNPFWKARHDIKDVLTRYYFLAGKLQYTDIQAKLAGMFLFKIAIKLQLTLNYHLITIQ